MRNDELTQHEARLAQLRRSMETLEGEALKLARTGAAETAAEVIEAVRREMATLEAITRAVEPAQRHDALRGMTPGMAFCLAS